MHDTHDVAGRIVPSAPPVVTGEAAAAVPQPVMDPRMRSIQPGGGAIMRLELAWGHVRRWCLWTLRRGYVERMRRLRKGTENRCPHAVLDPRDVKFYRNQAGYHWDAKDDPFAWRDRLPFARVGLAELFVFSVMTFGMAGVIAWFVLTRGVTGWLAAFFWLDAAALTVIGVLIGWFFRNPRRWIPTEPGVVVAPADGKVVAVQEIEHDEFIGGPAVQIGIFLSIFNVHINRVPVGCRVLALRYTPGKFLNALRPESSRENEQVAIYLEGRSAPRRRMIVRQIAGAIARRIVCWLKPGDELAIGEQLGMIKLGSRTELVLPREEGLSVRVLAGDRVRAGSTIIARYGVAEGD